MNVLAFHFHTLPDLDNGRRLFVRSEQRDSLSDDDAAKVMMLQRQQVTGHQEDMPGTHLQRIIGFSVLLRHGNALKVWTAREADLERTHLEDFFDGLQRYQPRLLSWQGRDYGLPLLYYRCLVNGLSLPRTWPQLESAHLDCAAEFAFGQAHPPGHSELAALLGLPGQLAEISPRATWEAWQADAMEPVYQAGEARVVNIYLMFLRYQRLHGELSVRDYKAACQQLQASLRQADNESARRYLLAWQAA